MQEVTVALVALGGYGNFYLERLFGDDRTHGFRFVAGVDPNPVGCRYLDAFRDQDVPIYPDLESFYASNQADLVVIAAPIHLHAPFTCTALSHGSSVLCEKPIAPTIQDARRMREVEAASDGFVGIGYQWSFSDAIQELKTDILEGVLGAPQRLRTKVLWPRPLSYYHRNNWAAHLKAPNGAWVLDSPANNATAHYLHNCFYVLGPTRESSARPVGVQAELYRANEIENYDTAAIRSTTEEGVEILFYTSHPVGESVGPDLVYEFEDAVVTFEAWEGPLIATFEDGRVKDYGNPFEDDAQKLWDAIDAVRTGAPLACGIDAASSHTLCINGAQESVPAIVDLPEDLVERKPMDNEDTLVWVKGLLEMLESCYDEGVLPSELVEAPSWTQAGDMIDLRDYDRFPSEAESV
ncbi:MAG: Gfo/Idh/MocA family protein [Anaerolineae bacterium]